MQPGGWRQLWRCYAGIFFPCLDPVHFEGTCSVPLGAPLCELLEWIGYSGATTWFVSVSFVSHLDFRLTEGRDHPINIKPKCISAYGKHRGNAG